VLRLVQSLGGDERMETGGQRLPSLQSAGSIFGGNGGMVNCKPKRSAGQRMIEAHLDQLAHVLFDSSAPSSSSTLRERLRSRRAQIGVARKFRRSQSFGFRD